MEGFSHRSTQKQSNKQFKSRKASKSSIKKKGKAAAPVTTSKANSTKKIQLKQRIQAKRKEISESHAEFLGPGAIPKNIAIVSLCEDTLSHSVLDALFTASSQEIKIECGMALMEVKDSKQRFAFIPTSNDLLSVLDSVRVADTVIFVLSAEEPVDEEGEKLMTAIKAQGVPNVICVVQHLNQSAPKKQQEIRKSLLYYMNHHFAEELKLYSTDSPSECLNCLRQVAAQFPKQLSYSKRYPYLTAQVWSYDEITGTLSVTGFVRGEKLSANRLVHIPEFGDFQIGKIVKAGEERGVADGPEEVLHISDPLLQDSLLDQNIPDPMDGEQTWPTDQEIESAEARVEKKTKKVPKGTSSYQAAWILEDDVEGEEVLESDEEMQPIANDSESEEEYEEVDIETRSVKFDFDEEENASDLAEYLKRQAEEKDDLQFPDEVDTPQSIPASQRFARYRGLKSFRNSPWDPYENLPLDYARIFQFQNFKRSKKRAVDALMQEDGVCVGTRVRVDILNVPSAIAQSNRDSTFTIFGLHSHEQKVSVMNFTVTREKSYEAPIKSKEPMVLIVGFRRYHINPLYSTFTRGGPNNVHKYERYLQMGKPSMATIYAPIQFGPAPVLLFKQSADAALVLVATGSLLDPQPLRVMAKRIILTGHPFKIHKRGAVIRFMFYSPQDIDYFKPVQIYTKYGRAGHIKESLGTHGYMKCQFEEGIKQHDTICMSLYKRVFPKWTTRTFSTRDEMDID